MKEDQLYSEEAMFAINQLKFKLKKVEQHTLLDAAKAHTELLLNLKKVNINLRNPQSVILFSTLQKYFKF